MHGLVLGAALFLIGCSGPTWYKTGATPQSFEADKFDCEQKVVTMYGGYSQMGLGHAVMARDDMKRCLRSKGYQEMSEEEALAKSK